MAWQRRRSDTRAQKKKTHRIVSPAKLYSRVTFARSAAPLFPAAASAVAAASGPAAAGAAALGRGMRNSITFAFLGCALPASTGFAGFAVACILASSDTFCRSPNSASKSASRSGQGAPEEKSVAAGTWGERRVECVCVCACVYRLEVEVLAVLWQRHRRGHGHWRVLCVERGAEGEMLAFEMQAPDDEG